MLNSRMPLHGSPFANEEQQFSPQSIDSLTCSSRASKLIKCWTPSLNGLTLYGSNQLVLPVHRQSRALHSYDLVQSVFLRLTLMGMALRVPGSPQATVTLTEGRAD